MKGRLLFGLLMVLCAWTVQAQLPYGNEWVDHNRRYWRFDVAEGGMRRIDRAVLLASGFPVASVDPRDLMLFSREQLVPMFVSGEEDGSFDDGDFIEFRVEANDAWLDGQMYPSPDMVANPFYSYFNDTVRYYLTWDPDPGVDKGHIVPQATIDHTSLPIVPWYWSEVGAGRQSKYYLGPEGPYTSSSGLYVEGEGWFDANATNVTADSLDRQIALVTPRKYTGADAPNALIGGAVVGVNDLFNATPEHHVKFVAGAAPGLVGADIIYNGMRVIRSEFELPQTLVGATTPLRFRVVHDLMAPGQAGASDPNYADRQAAASAWIRYAKGWNMNSEAQQVMGVPDLDGDGLLHVDFNNWSGTPVFYAFGDTVRRVLGTPYGNRWRAVLRADLDSAVTQVVMFPQESVVPVTGLVPVGTNGFFTDFGANEVADAMLMVAHGSLMQAAQNYANYRETSVDNPYNTVLVDVDELYDQFGGGVPKHPLSIRRWCRYLLDTWNSSPKALLLIGKSVQNVRVNSLATGIRPNTEGAYATCLVPTYGHPASDVCYTIGLRFDPRTMEIPVGRLSVYTPDEVDAYRQKVEALEGQEPGEWMKNILHFAGGLQPGEPQTFTTYLNQLKAIAVDTSFGGEVSTFTKNTTQTFASASADSVRTLIEQGVTLMTFLAHAYASSFDITIDEPINYQWNGKHPLVIGNSCYIGNIHQNNRFSKGEQWVLAPATGPIGFLASTEVALASYLLDYSRAFYRSFSRVNHARSIGEHMKHAIFETLNASSNLNTLHTAHTFTLQGDPTIVLNSFSKPDYALAQEKVYFEPEVVSADVDTVTVKVVVTNFAKAINAPLRVTMVRTNAGLGAPEEYATTVNNVYLRDTAYFRMPVRGNSGGQGVNALSFAVDIDPDEVDELDNNFNNITATALFISSGDLIPIHPYDFAIVPGPVQSLRASTGDPFAAPRNYIFQIDTTDLFNSPLMEMQMINAPGGVVTWTPSSIYAINSAQDSTVFYWRCSIDSTGNGGYNWYERSFQYLAGRNGWGQAHHLQFKKNAFSNIVHDVPGRDFDFFQGQRNIRAQVHDSVFSPYTEWSLDLVPQDYNGCGNVAGWHVAVIDPGTFEPWGTSYQGENPQNDFGNLNQNGVCGTRVRNFFTFLTNSSAQLAGMQNMLENAVQPGDHVLCYTWLYLDKDGMEANAPGLMPYLEGIDPQLDFNALTDSVAYIFYYRKGVPGSFRDTIAPAIWPEGDPAFLSLSVWVDAPADQGTITSPWAGPAYAWDKLYWDEQPQDVGDSTRIILRGLTANGAEVELANELSSVDSLPLSTLIDAANIPFLKLRGHFFDTDNADDPDPSVLKRWQLLSSPVPECAIDPPSGFLNVQSGLFEGQEAQVAVAVHNVSPFDMDSLLMGAWVQDRNNVRRRVHYRRNAPLPGGAVLMDTIRFSTVGLGGPNTLFLEANTIDTVVGTYDQLEQFRFNNVAQLRFEVAQDDINPILDVTFDGIHILDGDIVSPKPEIEIRLDDENTVLLHDSPADTALFRVYLARPGGSLERVFFRTGAGVEQLQFLPATSADNVARILYRPTFIADGKYQLSVMASDRSNNASGDHELKVNFEVINRSTITEVLNYPNPFTTSTRFVFTVTGVEPPTQMRIQIMTVTGRVVREIGINELGTLRVGRNITEYAWDGTDQFGDRLARGVYLYRVIAQLHGQDIELRETGASPYFTKGFGKMYLLR
ncbi:MAG: C25 family cysteine peptidase [Flavobacteriales bacterium]